MAKVFLRVYNHEIESMIEGGQLDEAVAHCQHILKTYPMHVETYRLLGKAFLEARHYTDAADIFQRALMAVPDDFVSHVGMSIIRDDENKLDEAIWHMERAFEVQPSNSAIQGELRRLYGRRDGVEPSKIRLSRDALANMYSQGELFNQAIAEIRSVLAEDTNRPDLQVMLARAYYRSGQKVEAAEMAAALLKKYPYCVDALRVLVDVLPASARAENSQVYRQRLQMLDPYSSFTVNSVFNSAEVVDSAVSLERLEYMPGQTPVASSPDWASSLGIKVNEEKHIDNPPDWMKTAEDADQPDSSISESTGVDNASVPASASEEVPEWMRSAGWQESTGAAQAGLPIAEEEPHEEAIAKADIPDWLRSMAPAEIAREVNPESQEPIEPMQLGEEGLLDWLKPAGPEATTGEPPLETIQPEESNQPPIEPQPVGADEVPDWLKTMAQPVSSGDGVEGLQTGEPQPVPVETQPVEPPTTSDEEIPEWLKSTPAKEVTLEVHMETRLSEESQASIEPPLTEGVGEELPEAQPMPVESEPVPVESQSEGTDATPDWLKLSTEIEKNEGVQIEPQIHVEPSPAIGGEIPDWLQAMAPEETAGEITLENQQPLESQPVGEVGAPEVLKPATPAEAARETFVEAVTPIEPQPVIEESVPEWLRSIAPAESTSEQNILSESIPSASIPTSVEMTPADSGVLPVPLEPGATEQTKSEAPASSAAGESLHPAGEVKSLNIGDDALAWLESLAVKQGAKPEELLTNPQERSGDMPEWLRLSAEQPPIEAAVPAAEVPISAPGETVPPESLPPFDETSVSKQTQIIDEVIPEKEEISVAETPAEATSQPGISPVSGGDDTMAWLEGLTAEKGTSLGEPMVEPSGDQASTPDWIQKVQEEAPSVNPAKEVLPVTPETSDWKDDITITSWLSRKDVEEALGKKLRQPSEAKEEPVEPKEELPGWLKDLEKPAVPVEAPKTEENLPEWLRNPVTPTPTEQIPPTPASVSVPDSELPAWTDENIPIAGQTVPTMPEEWVPAETKAAAIQESALEAETTPVVSSELVADATPVVETAPISETVAPVEAQPIAETKPVEETPTVVSSLQESQPIPILVQPTAKLPTLKQTGMLSPIPAQDKDAELLSSAQDILDQNSLNEAMKLYTKLIKKGRLLDEVIHDLREAIYRYPVDVIIWQTLGDAYMRANRLQDALDAYTKAEELLR